MSHLDRPDLAQWLASLRPEDHRAVAHVLSCARCRVAARQLVAETGDAPETLRLVTSPADTSTEEAKPKVLDYRPREGQPAPFALDLEALQGAGRERHRAAALFEELISHPQRRRQVLAANSARFHSIALAQRLLSASREARFTDPAQAERVARLAATVLDFVQQDGPRRRLIEDLRTRAWSYVGNALRQQERRNEAEGAFQRAIQHLAGTVDPALEAEHCHLLAALRKAQRRFEEAEGLLSRSVNLYREVGDHPQLAQVLTGLGSHFLDQGSPQKAIEPLREARRLVDADADPRTALFIHHNMTLGLAEMEQFLEAQRMLRAGRRFYERFPDSVTQLRRQWLQGIILAGLGNVPRAEAILRRVLNAYAESGHPLHSAMAGLDLAVVFARTQRQDELKELAAELVPIFVGGDLQREALAALTFFTQAAERGQATEALTRGVARFLKRSQVDRGVRFLPNLAT